MANDVRFLLRSHYLLKIVATSITGPNSRNFNFGFFFLERKWAQHNPHRWWQKQNVRFCILSKPEGTVSTIASDTKKRFKECITERIFKNKNISKKIKSRLKNTTIDKVLTYASETLALTKREKKQLNLFERKMYRRNLGPVYDNEKENWRILTKKEIYASVKNLL